MCHCLTSFHLSYFPYPSSNCFPPKMADEMRLVKVEWRDVNFVPIADPFTPVVHYFHCYRESAQTWHGTLSVFIQGDLGEAIGANGKQVFLTVHDLGTNASSFVHFVNSAPMARLKQHGVFLHVCVPGQEHGARDLEAHFPTMEQMGESLAQVLKQFGVSKCIAVGEGAGADIVCRFALHFPSMVDAMVLVHCTSSPQRIVDLLEEKIAAFRLEDGQMTNAAWDYLLEHKLGSCDKETRKQFIHDTKLELNQHNLSRFVYSFCHRSDFTEQLKDKLAKLDAILVTGDRAPFNQSVFHMFEHMPKERTGMVVVEKADNVLTDAPDSVANALLYLCHRHEQLVDIQLRDFHFSAKSFVHQSEKPAETDGEDAQKSTKMLEVEVSAEGKTNGECGSNRSLFEFAI